MIPIRMPEIPRFTIRPFSRPARSDLKDALRVHFSPSALVLLKLKPGDLCQICTSNEDDGRRSSTAIAWTAAEKIQETVVQTSKTLQEIYGLRLGDKVDVEPYDGSKIPEATTVWLKIHASQKPSSSVSGTGGGASESADENEKTHWEWYLDLPLGRAEKLARSMVFDAELKGQKKWFTITHIEGDGNQGDSTVFQYSPGQTTIKIGSPPDDSQTALFSELSKPFVLSRHKVGGLDIQIQQINRLIRRFGRAPSSSQITLPSYYKPTQGLLFYGPKGTGKSLLIDRLSQSCPWRKVVYIGFTGSGTREAISTSIQKAFEEAKKNQPSLVVVNQLDSLAPKRSSSYAYQASSSIASSLRGGFEALGGETKVLVVAETRHPNDIDESLRSPTRFGIEIEIAVPSANGRLEILKVIRDGNGAGDDDSQQTEEPQPSDELLFELSEKTHGYTGADLVALMNLAVELAEDRMLSSSSFHEIIPATTTPAEDTSTTDIPNPNSSTPSPSRLVITPADLTLALSHIRPTALQEIFLSTPHTPWASIGGYRDIKQHLQATISRPLRFPEQMAKLNLPPRKGLLLYGPPGCSKTLLVKALATESGLNFMAVKGAELLSMYVGESERSVREVFRKARAASPSIIFFDEVDAIASARGSSEGGGSSGINVLTTLLNEIDGIEELKNVLVVAATNTPQTIDPALLRPGRLDHLLYVGPPDLEARCEILSNWFAKSQVVDELKNSATVEEVAYALDGYSGAEIVGICETAGSFAMDRFEEDSRDPGMAIAEISKRAFIEKFDIYAAMSRVRKGITPESVRGFEEWANGRS